LENREIEEANLKRPLLRNQYYKQTQTGHTTLQPSTIPTTTSIKQLSMAVSNIYLTTRRYDSIVLYFNKKTGRMESLWVDAMMDGLDVA
jgi:hypothetical protein